MTDLVSFELPITVVLLCNNENVIMCYNKLTVGRYVDRTNYANIVLAGVSCIPGVAEGKDNLSPQRVMRVVQEHAMRTYVVTFNMADNENMECSS